MSKTKRFYIVDLDRTLYRTEEGATAMIDLVGATRPDLAQEIRERAEHSVLTGNSFSIHSMLVERAGDAFAAVCKCAICPTWENNGSDQSLAMQTAHPLRRCRCPHCG